VNKVLKILRFKKDRNKTSQVKTKKQPYLTVSAKNKNVRKSTILLAVLFGIGLFCLWFMVKKSTPQSASAAAATEETQIEMAITRLTGVKSEMFSRMDEIVNKFYEFSDVLQVEVDELAKNPFELELFLAGLKAKDENLDIDMEKLRRQQLRQQAKGMRLLCIMQSDKGTCCMVNDEILYVGDTIGAFNVVKIDGNSVKLVSDDTEIVLELLDDI